MGAFPWLLCIARKVCSDSHSARRAPLDSHDGTAHLTAGRREMAGDELRTAAAIGRVHPSDATTAVPSLAVSTPWPGCRRRASHHSALTVLPTVSRNALSPEVDLGDKTLIHTRPWRSGGPPFPGHLSGHLPPSRARCRPSTPGLLHRMRSVGLATAVFCRTRFAVTIYARDLPPNTTPTRRRMVPVWVVDSTSAARTSMCRTNALRASPIAIPEPGGARATSSVARKLLPIVDARERPLR